MKERFSTKSMLNITHEELERTYEEYEHNLWSSLSKIIPKCERNRIFNA